MVEEAYQSAKSYFGKILCAFSVMLFMVFLVLGLMFSIILYRLAIKLRLNKDNIALAGIITTVTAALLQVCAHVAMSIHCNHRKFLT